MTDLPKVIAQEGHPNADGRLYTYSVSEDVQNKVGRAVLVEPGVYRYISDNEMTEQAQAMGLI